MRIHPRVRVVGLFNHAIGHFSERREMLSETSFRVMFGEVFYAQTRRRPRRPSRILLAFPIHGGFVCTFRLSLSLLFRERNPPSKTKWARYYIEHTAVSLALPLLKSNSSSVNEKKHYLLLVVLLLLHAYFVWVCALSLSLSRCVCACVRGLLRE